METTPIPALLAREDSQRRAKPILDVAVPLLEELVNVATRTFANCLRSPSGRTDEAHVILELYLHIVEMVDGVAVHVSHCCSYPAVPLLRSILEARFSVEYILQADTRRRALAWRVASLQKQLQVRTILKKTGVIPQTSTALEEIKESLQRPDYKEIVGALTPKNPKNKRTTLAWYQIDGGPSNLPGLAKELGNEQLQEYDTVYRHWSSIIHASDLSRFISTSASGRVVSPLRNPARLTGVVLSAANGLLLTTSLLIPHFCLEQWPAMAAWLTEMQTYMDVLRSLSLDREASDE